MFIYVLTSEYNDYNQYGAYFVKAYKNLPTLADLMNDTGRSEEYCKHVLNGGGRKDYENAWFFLTKEEI